MTGYICLKKKGRGIIFSGTMSDEQDKLESSQPYLSVSIQNFLADSTSIWDDVSLAGCL